MKQLNVKSGREQVRMICADFERMERERMELEEEMGIRAACARRDLLLAGYPKQDVDGLGDLRPLGFEGVLELFRQIFDEKERAKNEKRRQRALKELFDAAAGIRNMPLYA